MRMDRVIIRLIETRSQKRIEKTMQVMMVMTMILIVLWNTFPSCIQRATSKVNFTSEIDKIKDLRALIKKDYNELEVYLIVCH